MCLHVFVIVNTSVIIMNNKGYLLIEMITLFP